MRNGYNLVDTNGTVINLNSSDYYSYNENDTIVGSDIVDLQTEDVIFSTYDARRGSYSALRNINVLFNKAINKAPKNMISLNRITPGNNGDILVSQGPGVSPVWKAYSTIFPDLVYHIDGDESIILSSNTFIQEEFKKGTIVDNTYTSYTDDILETNKFENVQSWFSHKVELTTKPKEFEIIDEDSDMITAAPTAGMVYNKPTRYIVVDKFGNVHDGVVAPYKNISNNGFNIKKDDINYTLDCIKCYLADYTVFTSITENNVDNYVENDINSLKLLNKYNIDIWGESNNFSASLTVTSDVKQVSVGDNFGAIIGSDNFVKVFGDNNFNQITNKPTDEVSQVSCGKRHLCAVRVDGTLISWGDNTYNQISETPQGTFKKVVCTDYGTAGITTNNELIIWGETFIKYDDISYSTLEVIDIAWGEKFFIVKTPDLKLLGFGDDSYNQLSNIPDMEFESFDCGKYHAAGVSSTGILQVWGSNNNLQTDLPEDTSILGYKKVECCEYSTVAMKNDGTLISWGNDSIGKVSNTPTTVVYDEVVSKYNNVIGLKDGEIYITEKYNKRNVSGSFFSTKIEFINDGTVVTDLKIHLEKQ